MLSNLRSLQGSASIHRQRCSIQLSGLPSRNSNIVSGSICASSAIRAPVSLRSRASSVSVVANAAPAKTSESSSTVRMVIQGRRLKVTDPIKAYVEEKVSKAVENYKQAVSDVHVTLSVRGGDTGTHGRKEQRAEVTIRMLRNGVVRVEDAEESLYAAIDIVCDKIARKLGKVKDKAIIKGKWAGRAGPKGTPEDEADFQNYKQEVFYETRVAEEEQALEQQFALLNSAYPATVRRTKVLDLEPISVDDAIEAMEQVGHDFYVFRELESDEIQVVYKRAAEGYGVLVPHKKD